MSLVVEYFEIDLPRCALRYGVNPCQAAALGTLEQHYSWLFNDGSLNGFTATQATLAGTLDGMVVTPSGGADPNVRTPSGLNINGATDPIIRIDIERVAVRTDGAWDGEVFYSTAGHGESASFYKSIPELPNVVGARLKIDLDMSTLTVGGSDYITSTIDQLRFDFDNGTTGAVRVRAIENGNIVTDPEIATGDAKCFNCPATCQDIENYTDDVPLTLRFAKGAEYLPRDIECLPWITSLDFTPAAISLGENIGTRASLKVTLSDHKHSDAGLDKYAHERGYDPYERGSFWPRLRARYPSLQGFSCRWRIGSAGDALEDFETRAFFVESYDGPNADGSFSITAKDALKFLDGDRAQIPVLSNGFLAGALTVGGTSATLSPSGIGNAEYPASGHVRIAGREDCAFTRSNDVLTLTRAQFGTVAVAHAAGDRVQRIKRYAAQDPADIIYDAITNYSDLPASYIPLAEWQEETETYLGALYTFTLGEPVALSKFLSRVIEQAGLALWDEPTQQQLRLAVIRAVPISAEQISESHVLHKTFDPIDQPEKRASRCWVYYGLIDASKRLEDPDNYRSSFIVEDADSEALFGSPAIKKIFADGIAQGGNAAAERVGSIIVARHRLPPRRFKFSQMRGQAVVPMMGGGYNLDWRSLQDASGARELVPVQVVKVKAGPAVLQAEAEEMRFDTDIGVIDPTDRLILINFNATSINLRTIHDGLFPATFDGVAVTFIISQTVGATNRTTPAIHVGSWPVGFTPLVVITGNARGAGGKGGNGNATPSTAGSAGLSGGTALYTRHPINLAMSGTLWGGGGGGGGSAGIIGGFSGGGGGGAGIAAGAGGTGTGTTDPAGLNHGKPGTATAGGAGGAYAGYRGGNGGGPGLAGGAATTTPAGGGGSAGAAIDGNSYCTRGTWDGSTFTAGSLTGDLRGPAIN